MDNFKIIYKILKILEAALDLDEFDKSLISTESMVISQNRWNSLMEMMAAEGYIQGVSVIKSIAGTEIKLGGIKITLRGLEYLNENSLMKKAANLAKGIKDTIPGL
ncbi:MAG: YjcQ family protein [Clostridia bacterium]|nr:YjcQ family protein [Clostridia bacterium]